MSILTTQAEFDACLKANDKVAVDFYATWCGPCKTISPKFIAFQAEYPNIKFFKIDVDENTDTAESQKISAMPTFFFFLNGQKHGEVIGASEGKLKDALEKLKAA